MLLNFELDPQIIHHIIYSQAGSIGKAVIELIMNSVDANASYVDLSISKQGFICSDDGNGFVSKEDVIRYFGRFGTPHEDGDATYGRFRLGRGQIMAHASTVWKSNYWQMIVDTQKTGYSYDLDEVNEQIKGCFISGTWYEELTDEEYMSTIQEIRDLIRYTPIIVNLNGSIISKNPKNEKWDYEDEFAYYRIREDRPVSIYNQGVLVRHDSAHLWGIGGIIVSKKALGLNVSRTEILRKTCSVWKPIEKQFKKIAEEALSNLREHRKTEARREKYAKALLSCDPKLGEIFNKEEVITILPGKRHITMSEFLRKVHYSHDDKFTVVEDCSDIPKGEAIANQGIAIIVHNQTLDRFNCYNILDFQECLKRIINYILDVKNKEIDSSDKKNYINFISNEILKTPDMLCFKTLSDAFIYHTKIVSEKNLDKETRRAWIALKWCLQQYAGACMGEPRYNNGRLYYKAKHMHILLGDSNLAEAWTDGESYIAFHINIVKKLKVSALKIASKMFSLLEHEISHEGDSIEEGHDDAFFQRYHNISMDMAEEKQRYLHIWLMKYTTSLELEGKPANGNAAWRERFLIDRVGNGRKKKNLNKLIEDVPARTIENISPEENITFINEINENLNQENKNPTEPNWNEVIEEARVKILDEIEVLKEQSEESEHCRKEQEVIDQEYENWIKELDEEFEGNFEDFDLIEEKEEFESEYKELVFPDEKMWYLESNAKREGFNDVLEFLKWRKTLIYPEETFWILQRNSAAAGFENILEYLKWRKSER
ncbi:ATP-binding protein (plasmid) [Clostridium beijerinckii]|uniref:ATP-binding protein n=1 Tax=Clostridium beijerinckii TaxID=1520 RepID=UPI002227BC91|nr:ATP-binding protein [Clostridium beijerinckii]UYZ39061.1 ATP-binding protein [Clostridium beijerinckii]